MSIPGVQIPHWAPPVSRNAAWRASRSAARGRRAASVDGRQPLDRRDRRAVDLADRHEAGVDDGAVDEDRARAALAFAAALLRAGQPEVLAQDVEQAAHPGHVDLGRGAVDREPVRGHARRLRGAGRATPARRDRGRRPAREDPLRAGRQVVDPDAGRVVDRGDDRRRPDVHRQLADPLGAVRRAGERRLDEDRRDPRRVERGRDEVRREPVVEVAAVAQLDLLDRGVADGLERAALDLALGQDRVDDPADVVGGDDVADARPRRCRGRRRPRRRRPPSRRPGRRRRVYVASSNATPGYGSNCSSIRVAPCVRASSRYVSANEPPVAASTSRPQPARAPDEQPADDHRRPRRDGRPGVGDERGVLRARSRRPRSATPSASATSCGKIVFVPWPISVEAVRIRDRAVGGQLDRGDRGEMDLARAGEPGAVPGQREPDPVRGPLAAASGAATAG